MKVKESMGIVTSIGKLCRTPTVNFMPDSISGSFKGGLTIDILLKTDRQ